MKIINRILCAIAILVFCAFSIVKRVTINENHDVGSGDPVENLTSVPVPSGNLTTVQVFYSGLDAADGSIQFAQSLDGNNFDIIDGSSGTLDNVKSSRTFNIVNLRTDHIMPIFTKGSNTTGTIDKIKYNFGN